MAVQISKPAINLREELASLRNQGGLPKEDKLYLDNMVINGDFRVGLSTSAHDGWAETANPTSVTIGSGGVTIVTTSYQAIEQYIPVTVGKSYKVTLDVTALNPNDATDRGRVYLGVAGDSDFYFNENELEIGTHSFYITAAQDLLRIRLATKIQAGQVTFDNVSVQEVGKNLVTNGTFDYDGGWNKGTHWAITGGQATRPSGTTASSSLKQVIPTVVGKSYILSCKVVSVSSQPLLLGVSSIGATFTSIPAGSTGTFSFLFTAQGTASQVELYQAGAGQTVVDNVIVTEGNHNIIQSIPHGYDVKDVYINGELAREGEAYDYQVQTDGINQWLKPTVEPTATTETVVIGVRK